MTKATTNKPSPVYVQDGASELGRALTALSEAVADHVLLSERVGSLRHRLEHQRLQLALLGQFKRGKSTFINALLGASLLPIAVVPLTAVPVFNSWRSHGLVRARFAHHRPTEGISTDDPDVIRQFLFRFISEEANPKNQLGVDRVDLFYPSPILAEGLILIDTPGVGSTLRHNTEAALRVLPESDAAIFVVSVDPPITEVEIEYLKQIKSKAAKLFFVLNKIDYLRPEERGHVSEFVKQALEQHDLWPPDTALFRVSATEGLDAKRRGNQANLKSSGVADVERHLSGELAAQKTRLLEAALRSKAAELISEVVAELRLEIRALEMPLQELAENRQAFQQTLASIEGQRHVIRDLLDGERRRLLEKLERRIALQRKNAMTKLAEIVDRKLRENEDLVELSLAIEEIFDRARQEFTSSFAAIVDSAFKDHQKRIGSLIDDVRRTAGTIFNTPFQTLFEPDSFSLGEDPYWVTENIQTTLLPDAGGLVDLIMPHHLRLRRRRGRILRQLDELILRNEENLRWAILRGIDETFRRAGIKFEEHLDNAIATTDGIVRDAFELRQTNSSGDGDELTWLRKKVGFLSDLKKQFSVGQEDQAREPEGTR